MLKSLKQTAAVLWEKYHSQIIVAVIAVCGASGISKLRSLWSQTPKELIGFGLVFALAALLYYRESLWQLRRRNRLLERAVRRQETLRRMSEEAAKGRQAAAPKGSETKAACTRFRISSFPWEGAYWNAIVETLIVPPVRDSTVDGPFCLNCTTRLEQVSGSILQWECQNIHCKRPVKFEVPGQMLRHRIAANIEREWMTNRKAFTPID